MAMDQSAQLTLYACPQCGAHYQAPQTTCETQLARLLSLTQTATEPWNSTKGLSFVTFCMQHPYGHPQEVLERSWVARHFQNSVKPARSEVSEFDS